MHGSSSSCEVLSDFVVQSKQKELIDDLDNVFKSVETARGLARGDFPDVEEYRRWLQQPGMDFTSLQTLQPNTLARLDTVLAVELPKLLALVSIADSPSFSVPSPSVLPNVIERVFVARFVAHHHTESDMLDSFQRQSSACLMRSLSLAWVQGKVGKNVMKARRSRAVGSWMTLFMSVHYVRRALG